jgi:hypothetical protein
MKKTTLVFLAFITILLLSCRKDEIEKVENDDYLIFGHFYSKCKGEECVETYMYTKNKLYEDTEDQYRKNEHFNFHEIKSDFTDKAANLLNIFPKKLLTNRSTTYGCPDCSNQGGIYIVLKKDGELNKWIIDQNKKNIPVFLHEFIDEVNKTIKLISL